MKLYTRLKYMYLKLKDPNIFDIKSSSGFFTLLCIIGCLLHI